MESLITGHWAVMGETDRRHRIKLVVDEWGTWHKPGTQLAPSHLLGQQSTLRDALVAGLTLDIFHRHADKVAMANVAQLVNCLQSLFLANEDRFVTTPTFDVFELYAAHVGGRGVRSVFSAPRVSYARVNGAGLALGARRLGVDQGQDADAHGGQPAHHARRARPRSRSAAPQPPRQPRARLRPTTSTRTTRSNARTASRQGSAGAGGAQRRAHLPSPAGVGDASYCHVGIAPRPGGAADSRGLLTPRDFRAPPICSYGGRRS